MQLKRCLLDQLVPYYRKFLFSKRWKRERLKLILLISVF